MVVMAEQCRFMAAAYPSLDAGDTCSDHRHDEPTFALAKAMAGAMQQPDPSDEQIGWFVDDADAVVDDFDPRPTDWVVSEPELTNETGLEQTFSINGREYVLQINDSGGHVQTYPVSRRQWEAWQDEDCDHGWEVRPESDTRVCEWCGAER